MQKLPVSLLCAAALLTSACAEMFPDKVATGVARLAVRNTAIMIKVASADTRCGFESPAVLANPTVTGQPGEVGKASWRVENCEIDLGEGTEVYTDCNGVVVKAWGSFTLTATKSVEGMLTGDVSAPAVPMSDAGALIEIEEATFNGFRVETSVSPNAMTIDSGTLSGDFVPRLARDLEAGVCSVITPSFQVHHLNLRDAAVSVTSPTLSFSAAVASTNIEALNGRNGPVENHLEGSVNIFGGDRPVPNDEDGLDPDYTFEVFAGSYACVEEMEYPPNFSCELDRVLGENGARLSVKMLATLAAAANADSACGFASAAARSSTTTSGELGRPGGVATQTIEGCVLSFPEPTVISTDCHGVETLLQGTAVVSGTMTVHGILTGAPDAPAVPMTASPALISLSADVSGLRLSDNQSDKALVAHSGVLAGTLAPRMGIDTQTGACSLSTPVAAISNVSWTGGDLTIEADGKRLGLTVSSSDFSAVNGSLERVANQLWGTLTVDGTEVSLDDIVLDPAYNAQGFDAAYQCDPNLQVATSDADCNFMPVLAQGAARLVTKTFGMLVKGIDGDATCGFASIDGVVPQAVGKAVGDQVTAVWDSIECTLGAQDPVDLGADCNGKTTELHGQATITATKSATGKLAASYPPIHPTVRDAARFDIHQVQVSDFHVLEYLPGTPEPQPYLIVHSGTLTGVGQPITGEAESDPGAYYVALPISGFSNIRLAKADVSLYNEGKWFRFTIDHTDLNAFNGSFNGRTNELTGVITIDGVQYDLPVQSNDTSLDPEYDQDHFNHSYACIENLAGLVPW